MKIGDKVKFRGITWFWFNDIIENGKKLTKGNIYTVSYFQEYSSWTSIKLVETGDLEYNHMWFAVV